MAVYPVPLLVRDRPREEGIPWARDWRVVGLAVPSLLDSSTGLQGVQDVKCKPGLPDHIKVYVSETMEHILFNSLLA